MSFGKSLKNICVFAPVHKLKADVTGGGALWNFAVKTLRQWCLHTNRPRLNFGDNGMFVDLSRSVLWNKWATDWLIIESRWHIWAVIASRSIFCGCILSIIRQTWPIISTHTQIWCVPLFWRSAAIINQKDVSCNVLEEETTRRHAKTQRQIANETRHNVLTTHIDPTLFSIAAQRSTRIASQAEVKRGIRCDLNQNPLRPLVCGSIHVQNGSNCSVSGIFLSRSECKKTRKQIWQLVNDNRSSWGDC